MDIIKWRESYKTGIVDMDNHHRQLIKLINQLYEIVRDNTGYESVDAILHEMANYADYHFRAEENLLEQHDFPGLEEQRKSHGHYLSQIDELRKNFDKNNRESVQNIYVFLRNWLINHIVLEDKKYGTFLWGKGVQ